MYTKFQKFIILSCCGSVLLSPEAYFYFEISDYSTDRIGNLLHTSVVS
jgi:hypothetical protein